jgi:hypothetical protein
MPMSRNSVPPGWNTWRAAERAGLRTIMALKIMAAVKNGERDRSRLTEAALRAIPDV